MTDEAKPKPEGRGLHVKLVEVVAATGWVAKTGKNKEQGYAFAQVADIVHSMRGELSSRGILLIPSVKEWTVEPPLEGRKSCTAYMTMNYRLLDTETGEIEDVTWVGQAGDAGDKALTKAYTSAMKYFLINIGMLPIGDDPEADPATDEDAKNSASGGRPVGSKPRVIPPSPRPNPRMDPMRSETQMALSAKMAEIGHVSTKEMVDFASLTMSMLAKKTIKYADKQEITQSDAEMILAELVRRYPDPKVTA